MATKHERRPSSGTGTRLSKRRMLRKLAIIRREWRPTCGVFQMPTKRPKDLCARCGQSLGDHDVTWLVDMLGAAPVPQAPPHMVKELEAEIAAMRLTIKEWEDRSYHFEKLYNECMGSHGRSRGRPVDIE